MTRSCHHMFNTLEEVDRLVMTLKQEVCAELGSAVATRFEVCASEALANIVEHSDTNGADAVVDVVLDFKPGAITVGIFDLPGAPPFDLRDHAPDLDDIDPLAERGRGLALIMQCADAVNYGPEKGRNRLALTFSNAPQATDEPRRSSDDKEQ